MCTVNYQLQHALCAPWSSFYHNLGKRYQGVRRHGYPTEKVKESQRKLIKTTTGDWISRQGSSSQPAWLVGSSFPFAGSTNSFCKKKDHADTKKYFISTRRGVIMSPVPSILRSVRALNKYWYIPVRSPCCCCTCKVYASYDFRLVGLGSLSEL